jgi:hypothetical protein
MSSHFTQVLIPNTRRSSGSAIRMVAEIRPDHETGRTAIGAVAARLGVGCSGGISPPRTLQLPLRR